MVKSAANAPSRMIWNVGWSDEPGVRILLKNESRLDASLASPPGVETASCSPVFDMSVQGESCSQGSGLTVARCWHRRPSNADSSGFGGRPG